MRLCEVFTCTKLSKHLRNVQHNYTAGNTAYRVVQLMSLLQSKLQRAVRQHQQRNDCARRWHGHSPLKVLDEVSRDTLDARTRALHCQHCTLPSSTCPAAGQYLSLCYRLCCVQVSCSAVANIQSPTAAAGSRDMSQSVTLDNIRSSLIRQEDSIIFNFIERAQFALNPVVYQAGGIQVPGDGLDIHDPAMGLKAAQLPVWVASTSAPGTVI